MAIWASQPNPSVTSRMRPRFRRTRFPSTRPDRWTARNSLPPMSSVGPKQVEQDFAGAEGGQGCPVKLDQYEDGAGPR